MNREMLTLFVTQVTDKLQEMKLVKKWGRIHTIYMQDFSNFPNKQTNKQQGHHVTV